MIWHWKKENKTSKPTKSTFMEEIYAYKYFLATANKTHKKSDGEKVMISPCRFARVFEAEFQLTMKSGTNPNHSQRH